MPRLCRPIATGTGCELISPLRICPRTPATSFRLAVAVFLTSAAMAVMAQSKAEKGIYTCTDEKGRRLTADRPIPECSAKEQQILNSDGSLRATVPPTMTAEERTRFEARERAAQEARAAQADAVRRDRNLVVRYPTEAKHQAAREAALDTVRLAIKATEHRLKELTAANKPLADEAEFYQGKTLPPKLRAAMDANDASLEAQRSAAANQEAELQRINKLYDMELDRLRKLWSGAQPGSLGLLPAVPAAARAASSASAKPR